LFWTAGWSADYPDPENFLDILFHSRSDLNRMGYASAEVDKLLEAARTEMETVQRMQLYAEAERDIIADAPWVPLWHTVDYVLAKPYVKGGIPAAAIIPWLNSVRIDPH
jgi:ABC-type oligopeptide transport system substrate-binding subunit